MKRVLLLAAAAMFAFPLAARAQRVRVSHENGIDFTRFKTYSWIKGKAAPNPLTDRWIIESVDKQLQGKGLQKVEANGDLNIAYYASLDEKIKSTAVPYTEGLDWTRWSGGGQTSSTKAVMPMATMLVDLVDGPANKLIWRGSAKDTFTANQGKRKERINKAVGKMFEGFPPR
ncbi:MAG TPA: DUF4136 domain-containing protein [Blastocatellia bacterium]|nr:DUF4136 domain-containing protein [Blastocatellia bacterium]